MIKKIISGLSKLIEKLENLKEKFRRLKLALKTPIILEIEIWLEIKKIQKKGYAQERSGQYLEKEYKEILMLYVDTFKVKTFEDFIDTTRQEAFLNAGESEYTRQKRKVPLRGFTSYITSRESLKRLLRYQLLHK